VLAGGTCQVEAMQSPGRPRHPSPPALQSFPSQQAAALYVSGRRAVREARPPRRAARHATHCAQEAPRGLPTENGREQTAPASAGTRVLPAREDSAAGPRQRRRSARQLSLPPSLLRARSTLGVYMAPSARGEAAALSLGAVHSGSGPERESTAAHHGGQTPERVCMMATLGTAEARTTEAPDAGTLHVRDCTGGAGEPAFLP
jgi:hypothetical protein